MNVVCPECDAEFSIPSDTTTGEIVTCPDCGIELEVTELDPPTVEKAPEVEEDWGE